MARTDTISFLRKEYEFTELNGAVLKLDAHAMVKSHGSMAKKKFATKINEEVLRELRAYASDAERTVSDVVEEALISYLKAVRVRPAFRNAAAQVAESHAELLKRLSK